MIGTHPLSLAIAQVLSVNNTVNEAHTSATSTHTASHKHSFILYTDVMRVCCLHCEDWWPLLVWTRAAPRDKSIRGSARRMQIRLWHILCISHDDNHTCAITKTNADSNEQTCTSSGQRKGVELSTRAASCCPKCFDQFCPLIGYKRADLLWSATTDRTTSASSETPHCLCILKR